MKTKPICKCAYPSCPVPTPLMDNGIQYFAIVGSHTICPHSDRCACGQFTRGDFNRLGGATHG